MVRLASSSLLLATVAKPSSKGLRCADHSLFTAAIVCAGRLEAEQSAQPCLHALSQLRSASKLLLTPLTFFLSSLINTLPQLLCLCRSTGKRAHRPAWLAPAAMCGTVGRPQGSRSPAGSTILLSVLSKLEVRGGHFSTTLTWQLEQYSGCE